MEKRYFFDFEPITPVFIGAGDEKDWINGLDFIVIGNKAYVIDLRKAAECGVDINRLSACFLKRDSRGVQDLIGSKITDVCKRTFSFPGVNANNNIKSFIRNQLTDLPVIPGSSLKGAIRSVLFSHFRHRGEKTNKEVFGELQNGQDFMRFISLSDIELKKTKLFNSKIFNLHLEGGDWVGGWKFAGKTTEDNFSPNGFNTIFECVYSDDDNLGYGSITLKAQQFDKFLSEERPYMAYEREKRELLNGGLTTLFGIINSHTRAYLLKEKKFFETFEADRSDEIVDCIDYLLEQLDDMSDNNSCLLKMSAGSGFHSITGDYLYDDYTETGVWTQSENRRNAGKMKYKSRKIVQESGTLSLMGFVALTQTTKEEYDKHVG